MKTDVRLLGLGPSAALRNHATRRIYFHLSRFGRKVSSVLVRISDVNGPKGGVDKQCQVTVRGPHLGVIVIDELSSEAYSAIDVALERAGRAVGRHIERLRRESPPFLVPRRA